MDKRLPLVSRTSAVVTAVAISLASTFLVLYHVLAAALACGDDGVLDYGTGGDFAKAYCRVSFDERGNFSGVFAAVSLSAVAAIGVTGTLLASTRHVRWRRACLALLGLLLAWWVVLFIFMED